MTTALAEQVYAAMGDLLTKVYEANSNERGIMGKLHQSVEEAAEVLKMGDQTWSRELQDAVTELGTKYPK